MEYSLPRLGLKDTSLGKGWSRHWNRFSVGNRSQRKRYLPSVSWKIIPTFLIYSVKEDIPFVSHLHSIMSTTLVTIMTVIMTVTRSLPLYERNEK